MKKNRFFITLALIFLLGFSNVLAYDTLYEPQPKKSETKSELEPIKLEGTIKQIKKVNNVGHVLFISKKSGYEEVVLLVNDDTIILNEKDCLKLAFEDLKVGMKIDACFGPIMTKSIPPQSPARKIVVKESCKCN